MRSRRRCSRNLGVRDAVRQAAQAVHRALERGLILCGSDDKVKRLARQTLVVIARHCPVDQRLHLRVHLVEVDRCGQHDYVRCCHFIQNLCNVILLHILTGLLAGVARRAEAHLFAVQAHHFHHVSAFFCAARELCAQGLRIAALARAGGKDQYFLVHMISPPECIYFLKSVPQLRTRQVLFSAMRAA